MFPKPNSEVITPIGRVRIPKKPRAVAFVSVNLSIVIPTMKGRNANSIPPKVRANPKMESFSPLRFGFFRLLETFRTSSLEDSVVCDLCLHENNYE